MLRRYCVIQSDRYRATVFRALRPIHEIVRHVLIVTPVIFTWLRERETIAKRGSTGSMKEAHSAFLR